MTDCIHSITFTSVLEQLLVLTTKDKRRKVCKNCHDLGHTSKQIECKLYKERHARLRHKIKTHLLTKDLLGDTAIEIYLVDISEQLGISINLCKKLYLELSPQELLDGVSIDVDGYIKSIVSNATKCHGCHKRLFNIQTNTLRVWKGNMLCDPCWDTYDTERTAVWEQIRDYRPVVCVLCNEAPPNRDRKTGRFHLDHINMFNKTNSVCSMVNNGEPIIDIYKEIDKCQYMCIMCHHIVTDIEKKLPFSRIKQTLTRKLNNQEITIGAYESEQVYWEGYYEIIMTDIYRTLKQVLGKDIGSTIVV